MKLSTYTLAAMALSAITESNAFVVNTPRAVIATSSRTQQQQRRPSYYPARFMSESETTESAFVADVVVGEEGEAEDKTFDAVEMMGKGAAKVRNDTHRNVALVGAYGESANSYG